MVTFFHLAPDELHASVSIHFAKREKREQKIFCANVASVGLTFAAQAVSIGSTPNLIPSADFSSDPSSD
jgi:hypothetical protein